MALQGPTSSGKTTLVSYLAARTGHHCIRINNHEGTDLQEYLGSYITDEQGRLSFREGALVTALRNGHWIVLDELNLAPSEVLEALNRYVFLRSNLRELSCHKQAMNPPNCDSSLQSSPYIIFIMTTLSLS